VTMGQEGETGLACVLRYGGTEYILFIHGLGASKSSFEPCFQLALFNDYTLAAFDLPGFGESQCSDAFSYTMKDQADLVLQWIRQMDLAPFHIVGHSMGGVIGLYLAESLGPGSSLKRSSAVWCW
jgi:pimeloyl-ACP methyl ester carboxylesterase